LPTSTLSDGTFPSSPPRTGRAPFSASGSPVTHPIWRSSGYRHSAPCLPWMGRLPPFALSLAFPASLVGRCSHDYYGGCVTLGLAPRRRSRGLSRQYVQARCRCPTHPLVRSHRPTVFLRGFLHRTIRWRNRLVLPWPSACLHRAPSSLFNGPHAGGQWSALSR
jgi:hypothetical protein